MSFASNAILFLVGLCAGIIGGMGMGGGAVLIPLLILIADPGQHVVQSINLLYFIPTAVIALIIHIKNKRVDFKTALPIILFGLIGAFFGSRWALSLAADSLKHFFGVFLLAMSAYEMFRS